MNPYFCICTFRLLSIKSLHGENLPGMQKLVTFLGGNLLILMLLASCAGDEQGNGSGERFTPVERDESGTPLPCGLIEDDLLIDAWEGSNYADRQPATLSDNKIQSCSFTIYSEDDERLGEMRLIIKSSPGYTDRRRAAQVAKKTEFIEDLDVPGMWRKKGQLNTLVFDHGKYEYSLSISWPGTSHSRQLTVVKKIANHIVARVAVKEKEDDKEG